jgi:hypothetical protein
MQDLIEALTIMMKYCGNERHPTHCEHDVLYVPKVNYDELTEQDKIRLETLGFHYNSDGGEGFKSYRFGSC